MNIYIYIGWGRVLKVEDLLVNVRNALGGSFLIQFVVVNFGRRRGNLEAWTWVKKNCGGRVLRVWPSQSLTENFLPRQ